MGTPIDCMDNNMTNIDECNTYYICTSNCVMTISLFMISMLICCCVGCYNFLSSKMRRRPVYANLYTQELGEDYVDYEDDDKGLIIRGRGINTFPPKYSEH